MIITKIIRTDIETEQQKTQFKTHIYNLLHVRGTERLGLIQQITQTFTPEGHLKRTDQTIKTLYFGCYTMADALKLKQYLLHKYPDLHSYPNSEFPNLEARESIRLDTPYEVKMRFIKKIQNSLWQEFETCHTKDVPRVLLQSKQELEDERTEALSYLQC